MVAFSTMPKKLDQVLRDALELGQDDRAKLVEQLIESLDPEIEAGAEEAWAQEISRRAAEIDSGAVQTIPWDVVKERLSRKKSG